MKKTLLYFLIILFIAVFAYFVWNGYTTLQTETTNAQEVFSGSTLLDQRNENRFDKVTLELENIRNIVVIVSFILMILFVYIIPFLFQGSRRRALISNLRKKNIIIIVTMLIISIIVVGFTYITLYNLEAIYSNENEAYVIAYGRFIEYMSVSLLVLTSIVHVLFNILTIQKLRKINDEL